MSIERAQYSQAVVWNDIPLESIRPGVERRVYTTDKIMLCWHSLSVGMAIRPHRHETFDQLVQIVEGECDYFVDGVAHALGPGSLLLVPAGAEHYIVPRAEPCINIDVFAPPRTDIAG